MNYIYTDDKSDELEVMEFTSNYYDSFDSLLLHVLPGISAIDTVPIASNVVMTDFSDFPDGVYEYFLVCERGGSKGKYLSLDFDGRIFPIKGPALFFKKHYSDNRIGSPTELEELVPLSSREINAFASWFSLSRFLHSDKLKVEYFTGILHDLVEMDATHDSKVTYLN